MILKLERRPNKSNNEQRWWYLDDIKKISVTGRMPFGTSEERKKAVLGGNSLVALDFIKCNCEPPESGCSDCPNHDNYRVVRIVARMSDGEEYSILFDTVLYVLNDEGRTIDKIVANYDPK